MAKKRKTLKVYIRFMDNKDEIYTVNEINANGPLKARLIQDMAERVMPLLGYKLATPREEYEAMLEEIRKHGYHPEDEVPDDPEEVARDKESIRKWAREVEPFFPQNVKKQKHGKN